MRSAIRQSIVFRHNKGLSRRSRRGIDLLTCPLFEPMRPRIGDRSEVSDRDEIIRRYLRNQINRPFDEVYAEVCSHDGHAQPPRRIGQAVTGMVHRDTILVDGEVRRTNGESLFRDFYVHPETGTLQASSEPTQPKPPRRRRTTFVQLDAGGNQKYVQINGVWYLVTFGELKSDEFLAARTRADKAKQPLIYDWVFRTDLPRDYDTARNKLVREWGAPVYAMEKRQIGSREVRRVTQHLALQQ